VSITQIVIGEAINVIAVVAAIIVGRQQVTTVRAVLLGLLAAGILSLALASLWGFVAMILPIHQIDFWLAAQLLKFGIRF
jgi:hypothetical protein